MIGTITVVCRGCGAREAFPLLFPFVFRCRCADTIVEGLT